MQLRAGAARGVMLHVHQLDAMTLLYVLRLLQVGIHTLLTPLKRTTISRHSPYDHAYDLVDECQRPLVTLKSSVPQSTLRWWVGENTAGDRSKST